MIRTAVAGALLIAVLVGGFFYGATQALTDEEWPW